MEVGRGIRDLGGLARPNTPHIESEATGIDVDFKAAILVVQEELPGTALRDRGPPEAAASTAERAIVVVPASNRRKSGYIASTSNSADLAISR